MNKSMSKTTISIMLALLLLPAAAWAQQKSPIELKSLAEVDVTVTNAKGEKEVARVEASKATVVPGDVVIFTNQYANTGDKPATDVVIKNAVPEHMIFVDGSAEGKGTRIEFSVDKGKTYGAPDKLTVTNAQGATRKAAAQDYTNIRWTVEKLPPGARGSVSFRAKVK
jgi:uncharacterized repeat protein (TIGR01451 family)